MVVVEYGLEHLTETRQALVRTLKRLGKASIASLARKLELSGEAVRQQLLRLEDRGWVRREKEDVDSAGRPTSLFSLTEAGEHLFPKDYERLNIEIIDTVVDTLGKEGLRKLLKSMTERRVREWQPRVEGKDLEEKLEALTDIYRKGDEQMEVRIREDEVALVENNCPFLSVARERPALCSLTINTLSRLLGKRVTREERFQDGDGRCVFRVHKERSFEETEEFVFEDEMGR